MQFDPPGSGNNSTWVVLDPDQLCAVSDSAAEEEEICGNGGGGDCDWKNPVTGGEFTDANEAAIFSLLELTRNSHKYWYV